MADINALEQEIVRKLAKWKMRSLFPESGPLRRELYDRHMAFFKAGVKYRERMFMAGNRVGKTLAGAYETTLHATGLYPDWWPGRRLEKPIRSWVGGSTMETSRDIVQLSLLGPPTDLGTGMIPASKLGKIRYRPNTNGAADFFEVEHASGKLSMIGMKSYDQGRKAFEGTEKDLIWLDEEPPQAIYSECVTRTATTGGMVMVTFTPLNGATEVVMDFLENADLVE